MKVLVTGTHFTPAEAVIREFLKNKVEVIYLGRSTTREGDNTSSVESQVLPNLGVKFIPITSGRLQRTFTAYTIPSLLKIPIGFLQSFYIVFSQRPDVVLSFGGYIAVPVVFAAWLLSTPVMIHEQTLVSGLANKVSSMFADKIALSFEQNKHFNGKATVLTGNPIRQNVLNPAGNLSKEYTSIFSQAKKLKLPVVLITGGNQGSHVINTSVEGSLNQLAKIACVIHQTGDSKNKDYERLKEYKNPGYLAKKWIGEEWGLVLEKVDLVISRAGINTLLEAAYLGKPTLAIPIPYIYQDEQLKNAGFFNRLGLVRTLPQSKLTRKTLLGEIRYMIKNLGLLKLNAQNARSVVYPDAAKMLALETILLYKGTLAYH